jgi:hypothetical protein
MLLPKPGDSTNHQKNHNRNNRKRLNVQQVRDKIEELREDDQLQLSRLFDDEQIHEICRELNVHFRERDLTPAVTLGLYVSQVLNRDEACTATMTRFNRSRKEAGLMPVSSDPSAYCKARGRLPLELIERLTADITDRMHLQTPGQWKWKGRDVYLVDGLVLTAPDTQKNQEVYPQPSSQQEGLGFPQVRMVITTALATGCVLHYNTGKVEGKKTGEVSLFREKHSTFTAGDIVIGDSNFESFTDAALLKGRGVDVVCCINGTRESPFTGRCTRIEEETKTIPKPAFHADRFTRAQWESLPDSIDVRIIRYRISGRREVVTLVTTLTDRARYSAEEIAELYGFRWDVELDIRSMKTTLGMGRLRCLTPNNLDCEIAVHVLAYNLVRWLMCDTAKVFDSHPREISFSTARDAWLGFADELETVEDLLWIVLSAGARFVRNRPGRDEPRAIKRRHGKYERLKIPRPSRQKRMALAQEAEP